MRKFMTFLTMILVLLSSGAAQMAYHICEEDGAHIWEKDCHVETFKTADSSKGCCSRKSTPSMEENPCCTSAYFFALSPLPVSPIQFKLQKSIQAYSPAWNRVSEVSLSRPSHQSLWVSVGKHPPKSGELNPNQDVLCVWII